MEEYRRLYELYLNKSDTELQEILNPENGYTPAAVKAATAILKYGRITYEQALEKQSSVVILPQAENPPTFTPHKPVWLLAVCAIFGIIGGIILISGISDLVRSNEPENELIGCYYVGSITGSASYYGLIFYFYDKNTFRYTTETAGQIGYGTYEIDGNALTLHLSTDTYSTVLTDNGNKIMINDAQLDKVKESKTLSAYRKLFEQTN